jgi:predicted enzyme related to lactoylglutathione lyase
MTIRTITPVGAPCWADLWTTDVDGSREFYSRLLGWAARDPSREFGGYWMFDRSGAPVAGGMGSMPDLTADNAWKPYFCTDDVEATLKRAEAAGGTVQAGAMAVADLGVQAVLTDPAGATFGLWQPGTFHGFSVIGEAGAPSWFELQTADPDAASAFYRDVLGHELTKVVDTAEFRYYTFRTPGSEEDLGGMLDGTQWLPAGGARWGIYWHVEDARATAEQVTALGGIVRQGPDDTPYGVLVVAADPAGAEFKLRS